jgi:hypothetical protein
MTSKNRVFSHSNDNNFSDYIKNKRGVAIIKNIKTKIGNNPIKYFYNYNDFIIITKVYYKYLSNNKHNNLCVPTNMLSANTSFLLYDKFQAHVNTCKYCNSYKDVFSLCDIKCDDLMGVLYPYGNCINKNTNNMYFPSKIDLNNWCSEKCYELEVEQKIVKEQNKHVELECDCSKFNGLRSPLFI